MKKNFLSILICVLSVTFMFFTACTTNSTSSETVSAESNEPDDFEIAELYSHGEKVELSDEQINELITLAQYSVSGTNTTLNTIITDSDFEKAKQNGVALRINDADDKRNTIIIIISDDYGAIASKGGSSAKMVGSDVSSRILEMAGAEADTPDTASTLEVTQSNGLMMAMMIYGNGVSVKEPDIDPIYNIAKEIKENEDNIIKVILSSGYVNAVREQGTYIELYSQTDSGHITIYLPTGHQGVAVFDDTDAYSISDEIRSKLRNITERYQTAEVDFEYDMLDENIGIDITYFTKEFRTDVNTKDSLRDLLLEVISEENIVAEPSMENIEGYDDIEKYAYEKGVTVNILNEDEPFKAYFTQTLYDNKYDVVYAGNMYYKIDDEHLTQIGELLGITL